MKSDISAEVREVLPLKVLLVAPAPPPYGGMALQARKLETLLRGDGHHVSFFASNLAFPGWLRPLDRLRFQGSFWPLPGSFQAMGDSLLGGPEGGRLASLQVNPNSGDGRWAWWERA